MWIVRLALRNPYSVAVVALILLIMGGLSIFTMYVDIFPEVNIPVVSVIWSYPGLSAEEIETRIVVINERAFSTTVQGISKIESQSLPGIGNIRVYFEEKTEIGTAVSQVSAVCETILRILPPGMTPPNVLPFNAASVPVAQLTLTSESASEQSLFDFGLNFLRLRLFTIPGLATPAPYGGASREINVDVDSAAAFSKGISPQDISASIQDSNIIVPGGIARIGGLEYNIVTNASPKDLETFRHFPIKVSAGREVELGEVAKVSDSHADQTNIVRINGKRAVYLNILKKADASTISVIERVKKILPTLKENSPPGTQIKLDFDQSVFVRSAVFSVLQEALIAAILVSAMILIFLGSLRSVLIVCTSIPLAAMASIIALKLTGNSINVMTLGGLALSIGMLVDDATVEIENINRNRPGAENITDAILKAASQIALPALATTLAICIVFFPILFLTGPSKYLFLALSESVVYAMLASYVLSRTLVPVLSRILLRNAPMEGQNDKSKDHTRFAKIIQKFNQRREKFLDGVRDRYTKILGFLIGVPYITLGAATVFFLLSLLLPFFVIGRDFFPTTDVGILKIHFRAPAGTRIEVTEKIIVQAEQEIRKIVPADELETINSMIGVPTSYNLGFVPSDNATSMDTEILVALKEKHRPSAEYRSKIRKDFAERFPGSVIYFQAADMVSQILNFGLPAPVDIQLQAKDSDVAYAFALKLRDKARLIPGMEDVIIRQVRDYPALKINFDRERALQMGVTARTATSDLLYALTGSGQVAPSYYISPENNVNYQVVTKLPIPELSSIRDVLNLPIKPDKVSGSPQQSNPRAGADQPHPLAQTIGNLATLESESRWTQISHANVQKVIDILANVENRDLGGVVTDIRKTINSLENVPDGLKIKLFGQNDVMEESFKKLGLGMILAAVLVYLLMVTLFQSWLDPMIIMVAVPGSLSGILWGLTLTGTSINVESLMGSIMAIGIAVSNSNLLLNFANDFRNEHSTKKSTNGEDGSDAAREAALEAGKVRLRPILMTASAMVLGMIPMALGLSDAGAQNAPLGRAVIGGLIFSTLATLFVVPVAYSVLRKAEPTKEAIRKLYLQEAHFFNEEQPNEA